MCRPAAIAAIALFVASCGAFDKKPPQPCPAVTVLKDAAQMVRYRPGAGRDLIDIMEQAKFSRIEHKCEYKGDRIIVDLNIDIIIERGPAAESNVIALPYFIAVIDAQQQILAKQVFEKPVTLPADRRRIGIREETEQTIPLRGSESGASYEILVGFQLNREELDANRRRAR